MRLRTPGRIGMASRWSGREFGDDGRRQPRGFAAEDEHVAGRELRVVQRARGLGRQCEIAARPGALQDGAAGRPIAVDRDARVLVIVETGALQVAVVHPETERLDQMQVRRRVRGQADHVAGVGRNFRMDQHDGEHGGKFHSQRDAETPRKAT